MKKNLLVLSFLTFCFCFSQTYKPLLKEGNKWWETALDTSGSFSYGRENTYIYINGESVINGVTYKKLYSNTYEVCMSASQQSSCVPTNYEDDFFGYFREDVIAKKVYAYNANISGDEIIYDFLKNVGGEIAFQLTVQNIHHGNVFGQDVKAFQLVQNNPLYGTYFYVYEGVGSTNGLFFGPNESWELGNTLQCFEDTSGKSCISQFVLGTAENSSAKNLTLYYSKENRDFKILGNPLQNYKVSFYESSGKLLEENNVKGNQNFSLKNTVTNKILFYTITSQGISWKGKIIIY